MHHSPRVRGEADVIEALEAAGHEPAVSRFEGRTETAADSAAHLGVSRSRIVKSLVLSAEGAPVLALLPGHRRADLRGIAGILGIRKVRMATPEEVLLWTGFPVGSVPPLGHREPMAVLLDTDIPGEGPIYPAAGENNNAFRTTFESLVELTGGTVCAISK